MKEKFELRRTTRASEVDRIVRDVTALRPRLSRMMGTRWPAFRKKLDALLAEAERASPARRRRIIEQLIRLGFLSNASALFQQVVGASTRKKLKSASKVYHKTVKRRQRGVVKYRESTESRRDSGFLQGEARPSPAFRTREPYLTEGALGSSGAGHREFDFGGSFGEIRPSVPPPIRRSAAPKKKGGPGARSAKKKGGGGGGGRPRKKNGGGGAGRRKKKGGGGVRRSSKTRAISTRRPEKPRPRVVNLRFTNSRGRVIAAQRPLLTQRIYMLRVDIGPLSKTSMVKNPKTIRSDLLPASPEGHWLKVAVVGKVLKVAENGMWLFLPTTGPAWQCQCTHGGPHSCKPLERKRHLMVSALTPATAGRGELRVTLLFRTSVVQSLLVTADIVAGTRDRGSHRAVVDYNLTNRLTDLADIQPRALSVMTNDSDDGTHRMVFNGALDNPVTVSLTDGQMTSALTTMRTVMRGIHIEKIGNSVTNLFDKQNAKLHKAFIADLRNAAVEGWRLWTSVWQGRIDEWTDNEAAFIGKSDVVQIARKQNSTSVFPWAMVYSIPLDIGAQEKNTQCRLLGDSEWKKFQGATDFPMRCPFEADHKAGVICPYGFWGFRYQIEQPPSQRPGRVRKPSIPAAPTPLDLVVALSKELDGKLLAAHLADLAAQHKGFVIRECPTRDKIRDGLGMSELELAYFYCHGLTTELPGGAGVTPTLGVGTQEVIHPSDLVTWQLGGWPKDHWKTTAPLVFINGCHTADTTPQTLVNFVDTFSSSLRAAGVIGTEITLHQLVANEMGKNFLDAFQHGNSVGQSLHQARTTLLRKGNLLGLVYTAYCSADLKLSASVA